MKVDINKFEAIAFDFDGTLADTHLTHMKSRMGAFTELGLGHISEKAHRLGHTYGSRPHTIIGGILKAEGILDRDVDVDEDETVKSIVELKTAKYKELSQLGVEAQPGAIDFVKNLTERFSGKLAIVTTTFLEDVTAFLDRYKIRHIFPDHLLITEETALAEQLALKPAPDEYIFAGKQLKLSNIGNLLAFEDSTAGVESAKKAGAAVLALLTTNNREVFEAMSQELRPDFIVRNFSEIGNT